MATIWTDESQNGPNPYTTGGFVITTSLGTLSAFVVNVEVAGNIGQAVFDVALNTPAAGQATIKIMQVDYDQLTAVGGLTGLPSGVTERLTSGATTVAVSHTHGWSHDHAVTPASTTMAGQNANTLAVALQPNATTHTHTLNLPNVALTSGAEAAHSHTWDTLYAHTHVLVNTQTDLAAVELANGTNLNTSRFNYLAVMN